MESWAALIALLNVTAKNSPPTVFDGVGDSEMDQVQQSAIGLWCSLSSSTMSILQLSLEVGPPV
jgi:hypothetical protein